MADFPGSQACGEAMEEALWVSSERQVELGTPRVDCGGEVLVRGSYPLSRSGFLVPCLPDTPSN